ncbi:MAG: hypothetical protein KAG14_05190, partial [Mycoplasmataceae bacterium]|nr:hypothetical protein [Mycoplasmataceae bacterium]
MSKWENLYSSLLNEINTKDWFSHVEEIGGNASICFVSVGGTQNNDFVLSGTLEPTPLVKHYPSIQKICFALNQPIARVRLMRLAAKTKIYQHQSYYQYFCYHPVFIPLQTNDALYFYQKNNESIKLQQGELFSFEPCSGQALENKSDEAIIQLVIEYKNAPKVSLAFLETHSNTQNWQQCITSAPYFKVFLPIELQQLNHAFLNSVQKLTLNNEKLSQLQQHIAVFNQQWQTTYNQYGDNSKGELAYWNHILQFKETIFPLIRFQYKQLDAVGRSIFEIITSLLFTAPSTPKRLNRHLLNTQSRKRKTTASTIKIEANFIRPVFIVSAPRAGSTLLFN